MIPIFFLICLGVASYTDIHRREIPIPLFPACCLISTIYFMITGHTGWLDNIFGALFMAIAFLPGCFLGKMGGGDLIMLTAAGYILGLWEIPYYALCLGITGVIAVIILKIRKSDNGAIPYAPLALISYIIYLGGVYIV